MKLTVNLFLYISLFFISCEIKVNTPRVEKNNGKIRNGVELKEKGLKVEQAFLVFEDGKLVPSDNKVEVGQWVGLRLIIKGWEEQNGKIFIDGEEQIRTSEGGLLVDEKDLFKNYIDGLSAKDAEMITVSARITLIDKLYDYFEVTFRVWDKKNENQITGSYKLYLK